MLFFHGQRIILVLLVGYFTLSGLFTAPTVVCADDNEALKIFQLARSLYYENASRDGFTVWVNGDIGQDISLRRTGIDGGDPLPTFKFSEFDSGNTLEPKDLKDPYILNLWGSWCSPCREEFPIFIKKIKDKSFPIPVIFVNIMDFKAAAETFITSLNPDVKLTAVIDLQAALYFEMGFTVMPYTILVDTEGKVQAIQIGTITDLTEREPVASLRVLTREHRGTPSNQRFDGDPDRRVSRMASALAL